MPKGPECQVERCKFPATKMHRLKEQSGPFDYPTDFAVCDIHKDKLSDSATEWMLLYEDDGVRRLLVGPMLTELDEFLVLAPITKLTVYSQSSRVVSHPESNGYYLPIRVRRRGGEEETLTLVLPFDALVETADFLHGIAHRNDKVDEP
ncbi:hypothetical protein [Mycolicibacterium pallens]|uniref:Uncharacterized protein n=1 Tax=Mycolicibacterium pallens TaxID=370524 RepID=A0ABX8VRE0_9MYCO|nr:hypothetical protein [Mycolicibacterium pallens]QYL18683.1 hypothetical protein K0O64_09410 [Mycolicibacterium pallens]